jgi:hypothetical protein
VKTDLGLVLGLYGKEAHGDLTAIRRIRDQFAHKQSIREFDNPKIDEHCRDLRLYKRFKDPKTLRKPMSSNDGKYLRSVQILLSYLYSETVANEPTLVRPKFLPW